MTSDTTVYHQEFLVRDLKTRSVTIGPGWATVIREIEDVQIKPGPNEITIYGLDPSVDSDSIKVEGHGAAATITDMTVAMIPNKERFYDTYSPMNDSNDDSDEEIDEESSESDYGIDTTNLEAAEAKLRDIKFKIAEANNKQSMALTSLEFLDHYGKTIEADKAEVSEVKQYLTLYEEQRVILNGKYQKSATEIAEAGTELKKQEKKVAKLKRAVSIALEKASRADRKEKYKKRNARDQRRQVKALKQQERRKFWPRTIGQVILHIEGCSPSDFTPASTPGGPNSSPKQNDSADPSSLESSSDKLTLLLTYVIGNASWEPRYELRLDTPSSSGNLIYCAEFRNTSSETWKNAKVTLSTSQASFSGLDQKAPKIEPWQIKFVDGRPFTMDESWTGALQTTKELQTGLSQFERPFQKSTQKNQPIFGGYGHGTFGEKPHTSSLFGKPLPSQQNWPNQLQQAQAQTTLFPGGNGSSAFGSTNRPQQLSGGLFGSSNTQQSTSAVPLEFLHTQQPTSAGLFGSTAQTSRGGVFSSLDPANESVPMPSQSEMQQPQQMYQPATQPFSVTIGEEDEGSWPLESATAFTLTNGLSTTFTIPKPLTLSPSTHPHRHSITTMSICPTLSYTIIPKLRSAAFLSAIMRNDSTVTLLPGRMGLTLDDVFLGTTEINRVEAGERCKVGLGVDDSIHVNYAKPTVKSAADKGWASVFAGSKDEVAIFTRTCWVRNMKTQDVKFVVREQVPVSQDEKCKIYLKQPKGLGLEEVGKKVVVDAVVDGDKGTGLGKGGKAVAILEKDGEVKWEVTLGKGGKCKLVLEYECKIPAGGRVLCVD